MSNAPDSGHIFFQENEYFQLIYDNAIEGIYLREMNGPIISLNNAMVKMFGYESSDDMIASVTARQTYVRPEQYDEIVDMILEKGQVIGVEIELFRKDGTRFWGQLSSRQFVDPKTGASLIQGSILDITEKKKVEAACLESEARYRHLLDVSPDAVVVYDLKGNLLYGNPVFTKIYGWSLEEWKGEKIKFVPEDDREPTRNGIKRALSGELIEVETKRYTKEGRLLDVHLKVAPFYDLAGELAGMYVIHRDITRTKQIEKNFQDLFAITSDCVYTHDLEGRFVSVNPATAEGLGVEQESLIGKSIIDFMPETYKHLFYSEFIPQITRTGKYKGLMVLISADNKTLYLEFGSFLKEEESGQMLISGIGRFVTDRINAEKELINTKDQMVQAHKMEAMTELTRGISHDFNNLFQSIIQPIQMARESELLDTGTRRFLDIAQTSASRGAELVRQLMTFSRRVEPRFQTVNLYDIVDMAIEELIPRIPDKISLRSMHGKNQESVRIDPSQVKQVLLNLGENALEAMPDGGSLVFETFRVQPDSTWPYTDVKPGTYEVVMVSDTGIGIPKSMMKKIFEPFFSTKEPGRGGGLGLSMAYGVAKTHRACITCQSSPGKGSTFSIFFPIDSSNTASSDKSCTADLAAENRIRCILLADDEEYIREIVSQVLVMAGCQVHEASNGREALEIYGKKGVDIDLVILDLTMPLMGGKECLVELLNYDAYAKVIVATESSDLDTLDSLRALGARGIIQKPFTSAELLAEVNRVV